MELWIRAQDKERLCKANNLFIKNLAICCSYNEENNDFDYLGVYKSKERALEVLDEIQNLLKPKVIVTDDKQKMFNSNDVIYSIDIIKNINTDIQELSTYVYEMPEE